MRALLLFSAVLLLSLNVIYGQSPLPLRPAAAGQQRPGAKKPSEEEIKKCQEFRKSGKKCLWGLKRDENNCSSGCECECPAVNPEECTTNCSATLECEKHPMARCVMDSCLTGKCMPYWTYSGHRVVNCSENKKWDKTMKGFDLVSKFLAEPQGAMTDEKYKGAKMCLKKMIIPMVDIMILSQEQRTVWYKNLFALTERKNGADYEPDTPEEMKKKKMKMTKPDCATLFEFTLGLNNRFVISESDYEDLYYKSNADWQKSLVQSSQYVCTPADYKEMRMKGMKRLWYFARLLMSGKMKKKGGGGKKGKGGGRRGGMKKGPKGPKGPRRPDSPMEPRPLGPRPEPGGPRPGRPGRGGGPRPGPGGPRPGRPGRRPRPGPMHRNPDIQEHRQKSTMWFLKTSTECKAFQPPKAFKGRLPSLADGVFSCKNQMRKLRGCQQKLCSIYCNIVGLGQRIRKCGEQCQQCMREFDAFESGSLPSVSESGNNGANAERVTGSKSPVGKTGMKRKERPMSEMMKKIMAKKKEMAAEILKFITETWVSGNGGIEDPQLSPACNSSNLLGMNFFLSIMEDKFHQRGKMMVHSYMRGKTVTEVFDEMFAKSEEMYSGSMLKKMMKNKMENMKCMKKKMMMHSRKGPGRGGKGPGRGGKGPGRGGKGPGRGGKGPGRGGKGPGRGGKGPGRGGKGPGRGGKGPGRGGKRPGRGGKRPGRGGKRPGRGRKPSGGRGRGKRRMHRRGKGKHGKGKWGKKKKEMMMFHMFLKHLMVQDTTMDWSKIERRWESMMISMMMMYKMEKEDKEDGLMMEDEEDERYGDDEEDRIERDEDYDGDSPEDEDDGSDEEEGDDGSGEEGGNDGDSDEDDDSEEYDYCDEDDDDCVDYSEYDCDDCEYSEYDEDCDDDDCEYSEYDEDGEDSE